MEKIKEILKDTKKSTLLGLISSCLILAIPLVAGYSLDIASILFYSQDTIGFIVYFAIMYRRLCKKSGSIKVANIVLIITCITPLLFSFRNLIVNTIGCISSYYYEFYDVLGALIDFAKCLIIVLFLFNILYRKNNFVTNKMFAGIIIATCAFDFLMSGLNIMILFIGMCYLGKIPYFYNYYILLKGEKENGK